MKTEFQDTPEEAFKGNARNIQRMALNYGNASLIQRSTCRHPATGTTCDDCHRSSENLYYFSVALAVTAGAVAEDKAAEFFAVVTKFAAENLSDFPQDVAKHGLYRTDGEFADVIDD